MLAIELVAALVDAVMTLRKVPSIPSGLSVFIMNRH